MNSFDHSDIQILLKKPIKISNLLQISKYISSIKNIEQQKRIIKLIGVNVPLNKIRESNIFGSNTSAYIAGLKINSLKAFLFNYNKDRKLIPTSEIKEVKYKENVYRDGYVYLNTETISLYTKMESFVIKYESINTATLKNDLIELSLNTNSTFAFEVKKLGSLFKEKLKKSLRGKLVITDNVKTQDNLSNLISNVQEDPSLCKLVVSSPEKTKLGKEVNLTSDITDELRKGIYSSELFPPRSDNTSYLKTTELSPANSKNKDKGCFRSSDFSSLVKVEENNLFQLQRRNKPKKKTNFFAQVKEMSKTSSTNKNDRIIPLDPNSNSTVSSNIKPLGEKRGWPEEKTINVFHTKISNFDSESDNLNPKFLVNENTKLDCKVNNVLNIDDRTGDINTTKSMNIENEGLDKHNNSKKKEVDYSLQKSDRFSKKISLDVPDKIEIKRKIKKSNSGKKAFTAKIKVDEKLIIPSSAENSSRKKTSSKFDRLNVTKMDCSFFNDNLSTDLVDYQKEQSEIATSINEQIMQNTEIAPENNQNRSDVSLHEDFTLESTPSKIKKDKQKIEHNNKFKQEECLNVREIARQQALKSSILQSDLVFHNVTESHCISNNLGIEISTNYAPRKIINTSDTSTKSSSRDFLKAQVVEVRLPRLNRFRSKTFTKILRKKHLKFKGILRKILRIELKKRKRQITRLVRVINSYFAKYDELSKYINEM